MTNKKITELVLDARWTTGVVDIDGTNHRFIQFEHPQHGPLTFHLTPESSAAISVSLTQLDHRSPAV